MGVEDAAVRAEHLPVLMSQMDVDGSGEITLEEFSVVATGLLACFGFMCLSHVPLSHGRWCGGASRRALPRH